MRAWGWSEVMLLCPHIHEIEHVFCSPLVLANMGEEKRGHTVSESSEIIGAWPHKTECESDLEINDQWPFWFNIITPDIAMQKWPGDKASLTAILT